MKRARDTQSINEQIARARFESSDSIQGVVNESQPGLEASYKRPKLLINTTFASLVSSEATLKMVNNTEAL